MALSPEITNDHTQNERTNETTGRCIVYFSLKSGCATRPTSWKQRWNKSPITYHSQLQDRFACYLLCIARPINQTPRLAATTSHRTPCTGGTVLLSSPAHPADTFSVCNEELPLYFCEDGTGPRAAAAAATADKWIVCSFVRRINADKYNGLHRNVTMSSGIEMIS